MTLEDKKRFDRIFHSSKYFQNVSDMDFMRAACECEKLFDYIQDDGVPIHEEADVKKYMQFAYWLGVIEGE